MKIAIEAVTPEAGEDWHRLRTVFWPSREVDEHRRAIEQFFAGTINEPAAVFLARTDAGECVGLLEMSIRAFAEGCAHPNPAYIEGIYVDPSFRQSGVASQLMASAETWAQAQGCSELASDTAPDNAPSAGLHAKAGFRDVGLVRCWAKRLD